jgi:hypothetical protein
MFDFGLGIFVYLCILFFFAPVFDACFDVLRETGDWRGLAFIMGCAFLIGGMCFHIPVLMLCILVTILLFEITRGY